LASLRWSSGSAMTLEMTIGHSARQVFDLPEPAAPTGHNSCWRPR